MKVYKIYNPALDAYLERSQSFYDTSPQYVACVYGESFASRDEAIEAAQDLLDCFPMLTLRVIDFDLETWEDDGSEWDAVVAEQEEEEARRLDGIEREREERYADPHGVELY